MREKSLVISAPFYFYYFSLIVLFFSFLPYPFRVSSIPLSHELLPDPAGLSRPARRATHGRRTGSVSPRGPTLPAGEQGRHPWRWIDTRPSLAAVVAARGSPYDRPLGGGMAGGWPAQPTLAGGTHLCAGSRPRSLLDTGEAPNIWLGPFP